MVNTAATNSFYWLIKALLCHNSEEGFDEQRGFRLAQEDVGGRVQRFGRRRAHRHAQKPAHLHDDPL